MAIEVKGTSRVDNADLRPLELQIRPAKAYVVCNERAPRVHEDIRILPWHDFLKLLWNGDVYREGNNKNTGYCFNNGKQRGLMETLHNTGERIKRNDGDLVVERVLFMAGVSTDKCSRFRS